MLLFCSVVSPHSEETGSGINQTVSLPRSVGDSVSSLNGTGSSSCTMPSRGSPSTPPDIRAKQTPPRYRSKQQNKHQPNGYVKKTSPLTNTQTDHAKITQRQSSPEILMSTVTDTDTIIETEESQINVVQEKVEDEPQYDDVIVLKPQPTESQYDDIIILQPKLAEVVKERKDDQTSEAHSTSTNTDDANTRTTMHSTPVTDTSITTTNTTTTTVKPAITKRPKLPPKPLPPVTCRTDSTVKLAARRKSLETQNVLQDKPPVLSPRMRVGTQLSVGRRSCSPSVFEPPSVFDDELESKQVPPAKPPRRRSGQISATRSLSGTPSPGVNQCAFFSSAMATSCRENSSETVSVLPPRTKPALPPKPRRNSNTSTVGLESCLAAVAERLNLDEIDLANLPYSSIVSDLY